MIRFRRTAIVEEEILDAVQLSPTTSTRRLSSRFDIFFTSAWRTSREQQLYPFQVSSRNILGLSKDSPLNPLIVEPDQIIHFTFDRFRVFEIRYQLLFMDVNRCER
ncbi:unnamed protein product [Nezara viridula]|uniref:Uncharacterized protein n=1 Tax=Nezara viridula TaxID=85310 RepID=A0A9P0E2H5_NEZVI|nr:unnamed protein product [Nezara viridula]